MTENELRAYQNLWSTVLRRLFDDATRTTSGVGGGECARAARVWFEKAGVDFRMVCEFAGVCPRRTFRAYRKAMGKAK